jgi:hypothetical protein
MVTGACDAYSLEYRLLEAEMRWWQSQRPYFEGMSTTLQIAKSETLSVE